MKVAVLSTPLRELVTKKLVFTYPDEKIWNPEGVSLANREKADKTLGKKVSSALKPQTLETYVVPADVAAPQRCVDGRIAKGWQPDTAASLGPKVAGGTAHAALAHRIVDVENLSHSLHFEEDITHVIGKYKALGIGFGGHIDDHAEGWNTGCGAVDNIGKILGRLQRPETQEVFYRLTYFLLGDSFHESKMVSEVLGRILYLDGLKPRYMPREHGDPKGEFLYKKTIVELLRKNAQSEREPVQQLAGPHKEVAVVFNYLPETTFDTDRFSYDHGNDIQVFGWDVWEMYEEAKLLYPYSMNEDFETQKKAIDDRMKYLITRTLLGFSTLMVLTDGSLKVVEVTV